ncbi:PGF-CTERM sorting domain-containing protein [Halostagnicola bangensis]
MSKDSGSDTTPWLRRRVLQTSVAGLLTGTAISVGSTPISAQENETDADDETADNETETNDEEKEEGADEEEEESTTCDGSPSMSRTSVTTPNSRITTEDPAVVEANFRPDQMTSDECTIIVDLEFSFTDSGFQWGGGAEWDQATSDLVVGTFEVRPGEVRDIRAELHTQGAEAGDSVTVVADYELWFEGNLEESVQQSGIRHTVDVEEPNPAPEEPEDDDETTAESVPGFGVPGALAGIGGAAYVLKSKLIGGGE